MTGADGAAQEKARPVETGGTREDTRLAVTFDCVSKTFGTQNVLNDVSCTLTGGHIYAITGANGSGKSTFLRLAGHLLRPSNGRIVVEETTLPSPASLTGGHLNREGISDRIGAEAPCVCLPQRGRHNNDAATTPLTRETLRRNLGLLSPELALSPELTGAEAIAFLLGLRGFTLTDEELHALLGRVGLKAEDATKRTKSCSTGQRQRLALAVLIASNAKLWLLDEPGANLDAAGREVVRREARNAANHGALVLVATNDEKEVAWADENIKLDDKQSTTAPAVTLSVALRAPAPPEGEPQFVDTNLPHPSTYASPLGGGAERMRGGEGHAVTKQHNISISSATLHLLRREATTALRSRSSLAIMALFAITALLALSMALGGAILEPPLLAALLWVLLFFAASMGLGGTFASDESSGALLALRVYGAGQAVLAGKTAFAFLMLVCLAIVLVPLFFVLLDAACVAPLLFALTLALGLLGLAGAGTLLSALTVGAAGRQTSASGLLPVLLLPVILPVFLPAISLTAATFGGREAGISLLVGMGLYDLLLIVGASLLFDSLWYED